uniref:Uncharacterized protein n=1 Tax=Macrostomum lignano TaxID=282301 RepID=A0A1I8FC86_9PLAT
MMEYLLLIFPELEPPNCNEIAAPAPPQAPEPEPFLDDPLALSGVSGAAAAAAATAASSQQQTLVYPANSASTRSKRCQTSSNWSLSRSNRPDGLSSRVRVHEVILIVLLITPGRTERSRRPLPGRSGRHFSPSATTWADAASGESGFFKALDTETMALLWQRIKGNRTAEIRDLRQGHAGTPGQQKLAQTGTSLPRTSAGARRSGSTGWEESRKRKCSDYAAHCTSLRSSSRKEEKIYKYYG